MIELIEINEQNWLEAVKLSVYESQKGFLDSAAGRAITVFLGVVSVIAAFLLLGFWTNAKAYDAMSVLIIPQKIQNVYAAGRPNKKPIVYHIYTVGFFRGISTFPVPKRQIPGLKRTLPKLFPIRRRIF